MLTHPFLLPVCTGCRGRLTEETCFFFFCVPGWISWVHHSSFYAVPAVSLGFIILRLLHSQLYLWGSPFFFFCVPSCISGVHHSSSSSAFPAGSLGFIILLLQSQLYLWGSSSASPAVSLGFIILLLLCSQLYLWGSPFIFCTPNYISGVHHSSSSVFPTISLGFTIHLLHSQLYLWGSSFFFLCSPSGISGVHHSSSSSTSPAISLGFRIKAASDLFNLMYKEFIKLIRKRLRGHM